MIMWSKGLYLSKSKVCTSPNLLQVLYDHVGQRIVPLQIYLKDFIAMLDKGLYLSESTSRTVSACGAKVCTSPDLPQGLYDHVRQRFVPFQIYLRDCMTMWGKGLYVSKSTSRTVSPCGVKVCTSLYLPQGLYHHVGKGLYLSKSTSTSV